MKLKHIVGGIVLIVFVAVAITFVFQASPREERQGIPSSNGPVNSL